MASHDIPHVSNFNLQPNNGNRPILAYLDRLKEEIYDTVRNEGQHIERIQALESRLSAYTRAYDVLANEKDEADKRADAAEKSKADTDALLKGHRVVTLIDGDGTIFSTEWLEQGQAGGVAAATALSNSIMEYLTSQYGSNPYQLWVYIFFNKRGLGEILQQTNGITSKTLDEFVIGFNKATERFLMVDVGNAKEAADSKIKAYLEDEIRLPQTFKILFGGCHDNGYTNTLRSQVTSGYRSKLVLLKGYADMAMEFSELGLAHFEPPHIFLSRKLVVQSGTKHAVLGSKGSVPSDHTPRRNSTESMTYSSVAALRKRDPSSDGCSIITQSCVDETADSHRKARRIDRNIPLSKHKPPPCTLFYLSSCKHGSDCQYAHDYILDNDHYDEIRENAKKAPCPFAKNDQTCYRGDDCLYGHFCPQGSKCHFFKQNRCKFVGSDMHTRKA